MSYLPHLIPPAKPAKNKRILRLWFVAAMLCLACLVVLEACAPPQAYAVGNLATIEAGSFQKMGLFSANPKAIGFDPSDGCGTGAKGCFFVHPASAEWSIANNITMPTVHQPTAIDEVGATNAREYIFDAQMLANNHAALDVYYTHIGTTNTDEHASVAAKVSFSDFIITSGWDDFYEKSPLKTRSDPWWHYPHLRISTNFANGYWLRGIEACTVEVQFFKSDELFAENPTMPNSAATPLNIGGTNEYQAQMFVGSLDHDSVYGVEGSEAVAVFDPSDYESYLLTDNTTIAGMETLSGTYTPIQVYEHAFYGTNEGAKDSEHYQGAAAQGVLLVNPQNGTSFRYRAIDTGSWSHNTFGFQVIGSAIPPAPTKEVLTEDKQQVLAHTEHIATQEAGRAYCYRITQHVPERVSMTDQYDHFTWSDMVDERLEIVGASLQDTDGSWQINYPSEQTESGEAKVVWTLDGNTLQATQKGWEYGHTYTLTIDVKVKESIDAAVIENAAQTEFTNVAGVKYAQTTNPVQVVVNRASLGIEKDVSFEHSVGDRATYTIAITNTREAGVAEHIEVVDASLPAECVIDPESLVVKDVPETVAVPVVEDGNVVERTQSNHAQFSVDNNALHVSIDYLPAQAKATIVFDATCTDPLNGHEVFNTATASLANPATSEEASVEATDGLWVNSPILDLAKVADKAQVQPGETVHYTLSLANAQKDTIATNIIVGDMLPADMELQADTIKIGGVPEHIDYPLDGNGTHASEQRPVSFTADPSETGFTVSLNYLVSDTPITIEYDAIVSAQSKAEEYVNTATAKADNAPEVQSSARLTPGKTPDATSTGENTSTSEKEAAVPKEQKTTTQAYPTKDSSSDTGNGSANTPSGWSIGKTGDWLRTHPLVALVFAGSTLAALAYIAQRRHMQKWKRCLLE